MNLQNPNALEMSGTPLGQLLIETLDQFSANISASWQLEHNADGSHGNATFALGSATAWDAGAGIWMAPTTDRGITVTEGSYDFRVGDPAGNYFAWDGSAKTLLVNGSGTFTGTISATGGNIGGWVITADAIKDLAGVVGMSSAVTAGDDIRFFAGNATPASAPFRVTEAGVLTASSATITGTITATSGAIGGWSIGASALTGGDASLDSSGNLTLGTSNDVVRISADDGTYRLWIGHATAASAPFRVTKAGVVYVGLIASDLGTLANFSTQGGCILAISGAASTIGGSFTYGTPAAGNNFHSLDTGVISVGRTGTGTNTHFQNYNANGQVGSITSNGSTTTYNTSSDATLKRDRGVVTVPKLAALKVRAFEWIADGSPAVGVFAQEAYASHPEAVTPGDDHTPWMVDYSKFVPDLIVGYQSLAARIADLEAR